MNDEPANGPEDLGWTPQATARAPLLFPIPASTPKRNCRSCGAEIFWIITPRGKKMPVDADGRSHFATCPDAAKHRQPRGTP